MKKINEFENLKNAFKAMGDEKGACGLKLLEEVEFLYRTMTRLRTQIEKDDLKEEMPQGSYAIQRTNPLLKTYNTTVKNYSSLVKQVCELLPAPEQSKNVGENLLKFVANS